MRRRRRQRASGATPATGGWLSGVRRRRSAYERRVVNRVLAALRGGAPECRRPYSAHQAAARAAAAAAPRGVLLNMSVGAGKTIASIAAVGALRQAGHIRKVLVVTKTALVRPYERELASCDDAFAAANWARFGKAGRRGDFPGWLGGTPFRITTFDTLRYGTGQAVRAFADARTALVVDEAHTARNPATARFRNLAALASRCFCTVLLSATPMWNAPGDLCAILNLLLAARAPPAQRAALVTLDGEVHPNTPVAVQPAAFAAWVRGGHPNHGAVGALWRDPAVAVVTYRPAVLPPEFPRRPPAEVRAVPMAPAQHAFWRAFRSCGGAGGAGGTGAYFAKHGRKCRACGTMNPPGAQVCVVCGADLPTGAVSNPFLVYTRRLMNFESLDSSALPATGRRLARLSPKSEALLRDLASHAGNAVVYSPWLEAGAKRVLELYAAAEGAGAATLDGRAAVVSGRTGRRRRRALVRAYNDPDHPLRILAITDSASEGLNLLRTRRFHVFDGSFVWARMEQAIGRAIRRGSHADLPPGERSVQVVRWLSVLPAAAADGADEVAGACGLPGPPPADGPLPPDLTGYELWCLNFNCGCTDDQYTLQVARRKQAVIDRYQAFLDGL